MTIPSYWNKNGTYQSLVELLNERVPAMGACSDPTGRNKALDRFRRASNCYHDLFNNAGMNRAAGIARFFGAGTAALARRGLWGDVYKRTESRMDQLIIEAAREQRLMPPEPRKRTSQSGMTLELIEVRLLHELAMNDRSELGRFRIAMAEALHSLNVRQVTVRDGIVRARMPSGNVIDFTLPEVAS